MPKLKQSVNAKRNETFYRCVKHKLIDTNIKYIKTLAPYVGVDRITLSKKLQKPDTFNVNELQKLYKALRFGPEEMLILFQEGDRL